MLRRSSLSWTVRALFAAAALVVSLTPLNAQDATAKVLVQVGQVSVLRNGNDLTALSVGQSIQTQQVIVTGPNSYAQFQISDGSTFEVFADSKVVFRQTPGDWQHLLNVFIGRVKVFIQHLPGVANPNNVTSPTAVISVRGTVFDVVVEDADGTTFVTVDEGIVNVRNLTAPGNPATLRQGDSIRVYKNQPLIARHVDKGNVMRRVLQATRDAVYQVMINRPSGIGGVPGGTGTGVPAPGGAQGDTGKGGGSGTPGNPPTGPGTPPAGPSNPPAGPSNPPGPPGGG